MTVINARLSPSPNTLKVNHPASATTSTALILYPRRAIITIPTLAFVAPPEALRYIAAGWRVQYARPAGAAVVTASGLFATPVLGMRSSGVERLQDTSKGEADIQGWTATEDLDHEMVIELHAALEKAIAEDVVMENNVEEEEAILKALDSFFKQQDDTTSVLSTSINRLDPVESDFTDPFIATTTDGKTENVTEKPTIQSEFESAIELPPIEAQTTHAEEAPAEDQVIVNEPAVSHEHVTDENTVPSEQNNTQPQEAPAITTNKYGATTKESAVVEKGEVTQNEPGSKKTIAPAEHDGVQSNATHTTSAATSTFDVNKSKPADFTFRMPSATITPAGPNETSNKSKAILTSTTNSLFGTNALETSEFTFTSPQPASPQPASPQQPTPTASDPVSQDPTAMDWEPTNPPSAAGTDAQLDRPQPTLPRTPFTFAFAAPVRTAAAPVPTFPPTLFGLSGAVPTPARFGTAALRREAFTFSVGGGEQQRRGSGASSSSGGSSVSGVFSGGSLGEGESSASSVAGSEGGEVVVGFWGGEKGGGSWEEGGKAQQNGGKKKGARKGKKKKSENKNAGWGKKGGKKGGKGKKN
ncbi:uncharacterized protein LTHEOB_6645 [Neofusicoccum parvum]|uniref:Uncharacterized protein LTHEOB_6645 n=1 Tax=Neofusicoccum parvum TaxID=310453 RepID=A0ACB5S620_9PEZI|nr:uncharacterized protein LTHEOB_6645 [Neofusicoccum parvum]